MWHMRFKSELYCTCICMYLYYVRFPINLVKNIFSACDPHHTGARFGQKHFFRIFRVF